MTSSQKFVPKIVIGSDETGVGDYLTPLVAAAVFVPPSSYAYFQKVGIKDSKALSDKKVLEIFELIKSKIKSSIRTMSQSYYNKLNQTYNANELKALLHLDAINALSSRIKPVDLILIDQFASEKNMNKYLQNIMKNEKNLEDFSAPVKYVIQGEKYHITVATASIVARAHFLKLMNQQNKLWKTTFPLGTNHKVEQFALNFVKQHGQRALYKVAKLSFKTTQKILK